MPLRPPLDSEAQSAHERRLRIIDLELDSGLALAALAQLRRTNDPVGAQQCEERAKASLNLAKAEITLVVGISGLEQAALTRKLTKLQTVLSHSLPFPDNHAH
jgi:hypothetical protein